MFKLIKILILGLILIITIVLIKYKPMYNVTIGNKNIGYINKNEDINNYIEEYKSQKQNIAFVSVKEDISTTMQLVNRNIKESENIKGDIFDNLSIEYTTYAITYNGKNIAYLSDMDSAEKVINDIKEKYSENKTKNLGVIQVYSDNYDEIKSANIEDATTKIAKAINNKSNNKKVKVASTNKSIIITKTSNSKTKSNETNTKSSSVTKNSVKKIDISFSKPLSGVITSRYGGRTSPGGIGSTNHKGLDISAKKGTTIKAAASGTVKFAGYKGSLGNLVIIDNGNNVETYYGHCSKLYVKKGQKVEAGDKIAAVGSTGAATGPHLHFEIHVKGVAVNPQNYLY